MRSNKLIVKSAAWAVRRARGLSGTVPYIMHQWRMLLGAVTIFVCCAVALYAYAGPVDGVSPSQLVTGGVALLGIIAVAILAAAGKLDERIDKRVAVCLQDEDSVFTRHRHDEHAHEALRRSIMNELKGDFAAVHKGMEQLGIRHSSEMDRLARIMEPIIQENIELTRYARTQGRRQSLDDRQESERG